ncbi:hypothetical protein ACJ73_10009 [Blastomyces percursus]|uniref:Uncharacterized protein n=1 Tax=Blastomyces percursus TaxID=1658174 RepID=A0A1J9NZD5_9EURO|nr:hypothetical protein ACJ73_10009 [Blastomyces percursus]
MVPYDLKFTKDPDDEALERMAKEAEGKELAFPKCIKQSDNGGDKGEKPNSGTAGNVSKDATNSTTTKNPARQDE